MLDALLRATRASGLFHRRPHGRNVVLDAGAGDGRMVAALAFFEPELDVVGIETDVRLFHRAVANLERVRPRVSRPARLRIVRGDYRQLGTYASSGIRPEDVAFVVNYPDGNQDELARFVKESLAPGVKLCLITHAEELRLSNLPLISKERIAAPASSGSWYWSVYST